MPARNRRNLRVCRGTALAPVRGDLGRALSSAYRRADRAVPSADRCRGSAQLRAPLPPGPLSSIRASSTWPHSHGSAGGASRPRIYGCGGEQNVTGYCQRLVTADLNQAERILDEEQRARALNRVDRRLAKDVPVIPLYQPPGIDAYRARIRNVGRSASDLANAENWWLER